MLTPNEARHAVELERRVNAHVVARTRPTPSAADLTDAATEWKRRHPGQRLAGHEAEVERIANDLWRAKRLQGPDTSDTPSQRAAERERIRRGAAEVGSIAIVRRLAAEKRGQA